MPNRQLARSFARRMLPLAAGAALAVALVPPLTYRVLAGRALEQQAGLYAASIAAGLRPLGERDPLLWRYNTSKVVQAVTPHRTLTDIAAVTILGCDGAVLFAPERVKVGTGGPGPSARAPLTLRGETAAFVEVRIDASGEGRRLRALAAASMTCGLLLGLLLYVYPTRVVARQGKDLAGALERLQGAEASLTAANADLSRQVAKAVGEVRDLSGRVIAVQEEERRRIARDLHDGVGQSITAMRIDLELARAGDPVRLEEAARATERTLEELRRVVRDLRPLELETSTPEGALRATCERFELRTGVPTSFRAEGAIASPQVALAVLRILQEALTNVAKHAQASEVGVRLLVRAGTVELTVDDDGRGIDPAAAPGSGLTGIRERCAFLGGSLSIESTPGEGTRLRATVPDGGVT